MTTKIYFLECYNENCGIGYTAQAPEGTFMFSCPKCGQILNTEFEEDEE